MIIAIASYAISGTPERRRYIPVIITPAGRERLPSQGHKTKKGAVAVAARIINARTGLQLAPSEHRETRAEKLARRAATAAKVRSYDPA